MPSSTPATRLIEVHRDRLAGWLARFEAGHGSLSVSTSGRVVTCVAADGAIAKVEGWREFSGPDPLADLLTDLSRPRPWAALLVRRRAHAVARYLDDALIEQRHDSHYVQGRTKAGGWSQQRYARRRANQADHAFGQAADDARDVLLPHLETTEVLILGGDRQAVRAVLSSPGLEGLQRLAAVTDRRFLAVEDPRLVTLQRLPERVLSVTIGLNDLA